MKNGVPYDIAFSLGEADIAAYAIIFGELASDENKFNWDMMRWEKRQ